MKYIAIWRTFMVVLAVTYVYTAFFYWWSQDTFTIISHDITIFFILWWWAIAIPMLLITCIFGAVLILFGTRPHILIRAILAALALLTWGIPVVFLVYWLVFVERFRPNNSSKPTPLRGAA